MPTRRPPQPPAPRGRGAAAYGGALLLFLPLVAGARRSRSAASAGTRAARTTSGFANHRVVIYKGVPGGVLGWNPTVDQRHRLDERQLTQLDHDRVAGGAARGSLSGAKSFVARARVRRRRDLDHHDHDDDHDHRPEPKPKPTTPSRRTRRPRPLDDAGSPLTMALAPIARQRRRSELSLGLLVVIIAVGGYILVALANGPDAAARTLRAARLGVRPLPRRAPRDPPLRARTPTRRCSRSPRCSTASGSSTIARLDVADHHPGRACSRSGSRSGSACSCSRWSSSATCACSSATATRSR